MACCWSTSTPKDTPGMWFLPPSRPPNFYASAPQNTLDTSFFTFSKLSMLHQKKSSKMYTSPRIFAMSTFNKNEKNTRFSLQKNLLQSRHLFLITDSRLDALFRSKKHNKKRNKNDEIKYKWVQKSMPKSSFFVYFLLEILCKTVVFQQCFERVLK